MAVHGLLDVDLPRAQVGANPQHLVHGLFTDYWFRPAEPLPSAALVALLAEFDITPASARAAISRLARRGVLQVRKGGRQTYYHMTPDATRALEQLQRRVVEFGADRPWDGRWTTVIFSMSEELRDLRAILRRRLRFLGYAPVYDGVWMSPHADHQQTVELLESVAVGDATVLRSEVSYAVNNGDPLAAWNLAAIRASYEEFITAFEPLRERVERGQVTTAEALVTRTTVKSSWQELVSIDPELPEALLPAGWPRRQAQHVFAQLYDALGPVAEVRVRQVLAEYDPALASLASHRTTRTPP